MQPGLGRGLFHLQRRRKKKLDDPGGLFKNKLKGQFYYNELDVRLGPVGDVSAFIALKCDTAPVYLGACGKTVTEQEDLILDGSSKVWGG